MNSACTTGAGTPHKVILILGELFASKLKLLGKSPWQSSGPPKYKKSLST